jgi:glyoxylase-like metal-dependent hydrolase (beta-lactamase superfamily II)
MRGAADMKSRDRALSSRCLFQSVETDPRPDLGPDAGPSEGEMTVWLGKIEVKLMQLGRGHTKGDTDAWLPQQKILFSGDLVEYGATV